MRSLLGVAALSLSSVCVMACTAPDATDSLADEEVDVGTAQQADHGSSGSNGLGSLEFLTQKLPLAQAVKFFPLVDPGTKDVSAGVKGLLYGTPAGKTILKYAVACAVPESTEVFDGKDYLMGMGHILSAAAWMNGPLPQAALDSLMACVAAHVNPYGVEVPILLMGTDVENDSYSHPGFDVPEALWVSYVSVVDSSVSFVVWPRSSVLRSCSDPLAAFKNRLCGQYPSSQSCQLTLGAAGACTVDALGNYTCNGKPAIETRLKTPDFNFLYKMCSP